MPNLDVIATPWDVREAGVADINGIARLFQSAQSFERVVDDTGVPLGEERADSAARIILSNGVLEHGRLWVARVEDNSEPVGGAVWMPLDSKADAISTIRDALARELELGTRPEKNPAGMLSILDGLPEQFSSLPIRWALVMASCADGLADDHRNQLVADLVRPLIDEEATQGRSVAAIIAGSLASPLLKFGFVERMQVNFEDEVSLWFGHYTPTLLA